MGLLNSLSATGQIAAVGAIVLVIAFGMKGSWRNLGVAVPVFAVVTVLVMGMGWLH